MRSVQVQAGLYLRLWQPQWGNTEYSAKESCDLSITTSVPTCSGGTFDHWTDGSAQYRKGDEYTLTVGNQTATLYAVFSHEGACSGDDSANCTEYRHVPVLP